MALEINDIHNREFERVFRGYNMDDVDEFLETIALEYDGVLQENNTLREQVDKLNEERKYYEEIEKSAKEDILEAKENAEKIKLSLQEEIRQIQEEGEREIEQINQEKLLLQRENESLRGQVDRLTKEGKGFDKIEETVQAAIARSQEAAEEIMAEARTEAEAIRHDAERIRRENEEIKQETEMEAQRINDEYEVLLQENNQLQEDIAHLADKIKNYEKLEETVHNAILVAQEAADDVKQNAKKESELIRKEAEREAQRIIEDSRYQASRILAEHEDLHKQVQIFKMRFRSFIEAQLSSLEMEDWSDSLPIPQSEE